MRTHRKTIDRFLSKAMTVETLIDELNCLPSDAPVVIASDYGDICHTQQLIALHTVAEFNDYGPERIYESGYSQSRIAIERIPAEELEDEDGYQLLPDPEDDQSDLKVVLLNWTGDCHD